MDNHYTVLCYVVSSAAAFAAFYAAVKSAQLVYLARWDVEKHASEKDGILRAFHKEKEHVAKLEADVARLRGENEKLRQLQTPKARW